ncbi:MAG TPA: universal stress protein [Desulfobacteraceae bacterium]|nr:universal stress protein [Desulfobacteraceae bacterium]
MELPQIEIKKILYATDLSESSRYTFAHAINMANRFGAGLIILHVMTEIQNLDTSISYHIGKAQWEKIKQQRQQDASETLIGKKRNDLAIRDALEKYCEGANECLLERSFVTDEIIVERGDPAKHILKYSKDRNCDLIVVGSHGQGSLAGAMIGSTAKLVLKKSTVPVLIVRAPDEKWKGKSYDKRYRSPGDFRKRH